MIILEKLKNNYSSFIVKNEEFLVIPKKDFIWTDNYIEKEILQNFLTKLLYESLKNDWYNDDEIKDFVLSYLATFNEDNLVNI